MTLGEFLSVIGTQTDYKVFGYNCYHESFQVGGDDKVVCGRNTNHINTKLNDNDVDYVNILPDGMEIYIKQKGIEDENR